MESTSHERGRKKLMLRLPELRAQLQSFSHGTAEELFESYELATAALERFRLNPETNSVLISEYRQICAELEAEVKNLCAALDG